LEETGNAYRIVAGKIPEKLPVATSFEDTHSLHFQIVNVGTIKIVAVRILKMQIWHALAVLCGDS
jgi:hypothetical protein